MKLIQKHIKEVELLCKKYLVSEMYVFGSVLKNDFSSNSDIDFLVKFSNVDPLDYFDNYMELKESLEKVFLRAIDLIEVQTIKNPILKSSIDQEKILVYGQENTKMAL